MAENNKKSDNKSTVEGSQKKRCFVIMPFSDPEGYAPGHFHKIYEQIIEPAIADADFVPVRVDENKISDQIIMKIFDGIINCEMAICDLSSNNPNVLYELGLRHAYDKPVVLIHDDRTNRIFDIQGISIIQYRSSRLYDEVIDDRKKISESIKVNADSKFGYSIVNVVKMKKAKYDANIKDTDLSRIDNTLLIRVLDALDRIEEKQNDFNKQDFKSNYYNYYLKSLPKTTEPLDNEILQDKIFKIDSIIKNLDYIIDNYSPLNTPLEKLKNTENEIIKLISDINKLANNKLLTVKQLNFLSYKMSDLERMLSKIRNLINDFNHS